MLRQPSFMVCYLPSTRTLRSKMQGGAASRQELRLLPHQFLEAEAGEACGPRQSLKRWETTYHSARVAKNQRLDLLQREAVPDPACDAVDGQHDIALENLCVMAREEREESGCQPQDRGLFTTPGPSRTRIPRRGM